MVIEKLKINCNIKNKTWTNPQIQGHKKSHKPWLTRLQTHHKKQNTHI